MTCTWIIVACTGGNSCDAAGRFARHHKPAPPMIRHVAQITNVNDRNSRADVSIDAAGEGKELFSVDFIEIVSS